MEFVCRLLPERGCVVLFVEQNFVGFGVCFTTLGRQGNSIWVYKIFILDTFIPTFIICGGFIFPILSQGFQLVFKPFIPVVRGCKLCLNS